MTQYVTIHTRIKILAATGALAFLVAMPAVGSHSATITPERIRVSEVSSDSCIKLPVSHPGLVWAVHFYHGKYVHWRKLMSKPIHYRYGGVVEQSCSVAYGTWALNLWHFRSHRAHMHYLAWLQENPTGTPVQIGRILAAHRGWTGSEFIALYNLWNRESGWNPNAMNSSSGACGIPQALPCSKIPDHSVQGQIEWGFGYIAARYGDPLNAWAHSESYGWY
jgi:hypothetical protein